MTQAEALTLMQSGANVFLTGEPGAGKTYTVNLFIDWLHGRRKRVAITASTGIAASHIGGVTIHSWSGIKMKKKIDANNIDSLTEFEVRRIMETDVLIVDEVSMLDANFIGMMDRILRHYREEWQPFGGIQIVFVGDFFQLPPVVRGGRARYAFEAEEWARAKLKVCYLTEQHRQSDPEFLELLTAIRSGTVTQQHRELLTACQKSEIPQTKLYTHNFDVDEENARELAKLPGESKRYTMTLSGHLVAADILKRQIITPEFLDLKVGARVMFTWNNKEGLYVNGTLGVVTAFAINSGAPIVKTVDGSIVEPKRNEWRLEENGSVRATATQYPLRLAWAVTVHKSQGMTLDEAAIDLSNTFEYGQGYVAISRVRSLAGLHLMGINEAAFAMSPKVMKHDRLMRQQV